MIQGKIFLAEERGCNETASFRSLHLFNFGEYFNEHKCPFGNIDVINDDTLDGNCSMKMRIEKSSFVILIPVIGAIRYKDSRGNESLIAAGQWQLLKMEMGEKIEIQNPFKDELVNFLQVWIGGDKRLSLSLPLIGNYDVNADMNKLIQISPERFIGTDLPFSLSIGKFKGRKETTYSSRRPNSGIFLFVIEGAFEIEGRLLHARDGLALWGINNAEIEALSNDAIVLAIEIADYVLAD